MSVLAHDLRTPISSARSFLDLTRSAGALNDQQEAFMERAQLALSRMESLVNDVLEMSRLGHGAALTQEPCDVRLLAGECVSVLEGMATASGVQVRRALPDDLPTVSGDPNLLRQMLDNLIGNAIKYNREGGTVDVSASADAQWVRVSVQDTGLGIPPEELEHIFDPFYRSSVSKENRIDGTGLGLAIAQAVAVRHGGAIEVESVLDKGTTFTVQLPR